MGERVRGGRGEKVRGGRGEKVKEGLWSHIGKFCTRLRLVLLEGSRVVRGRTAYCSSSLHST